jgi:hypothetical protein
MGIEPFTSHPSSFHTSQAPYRRPLPSNAAYTYATAATDNQKMPPVTELLVDPITRKRYKIPNPYSDVALYPGPIGKLGLDFQQTFVDFPKTIAQGLRGDSHFTFSDSLQVSSIPYYLGGMFLVGSFLAGGDKLNSARQGVGVALYYLGISAANQAINAFYKWHTGVDLGMRYRKSNGDIENVFASVDFPRLDLLSEDDYKRMIQKMRIPSNIADPKREVNDQTREVISASRTDKLILGNLLAAIGAGYIARNDAWARILTDNGALKATWNWKDKLAGSFLQRLRTTGSILSAKVGPGFKEALLGSPNEANPWLRRGVFGSMLLLPSLIFLHAWRTLDRSQRHYESPFIANLSPELAPEASPHTAALQRRLPGGTVKRMPRRFVLGPNQSLQQATPSPYNPNHYNGLGNDLMEGFRL